MSLAETIPTVAYFKLETFDATFKLRALVAAAGPGFLGPFDGEEGVNLVPDLDAGATGTMPSAMLRDVLGEVVRLHVGGEREAARGLYEHWLPLILYENRLCGLRATKVLMRVGGIIVSEAVRPPLPPLSPSIRAGLLELLAAVRSVDPSLGPGLTAPLGGVTRRAASSLAGPRSSSRGMVSPVIAACAFRSLDRC